MENKVILDTKWIDAVKRLSGEITSLFNTGCDMRFWDGEREVLNPTTGEIVTSEGGNPKLKVTHNLDLYVPKDIYIKAEKTLPKIKNSGEYLKLNNHLVAIATRVDANNNRFIIQFAQPNNGKVVNSASAEAKAEYAKKFGKASEVPAEAAENDDLPY